MNTPNDSQKPATGVGSSDLLFCPFCGGEAKRGETNDGGYFIECTQCQASSKCVYPQKTDPDPILKDAWNSRSDMPATAPQPERAGAVGSTRLLGDFERVCELIGSIYYYGNFRAETANERELEALLRKLGYFFENEEQLMAKLHPPNPGLP